MSCSLMNIHGTMLSSWQSQVMAAELQTQAKINSEVGSQGRRGGLPMPVSRMTEERAKKAETKTPQSSSSAPPFFLFFWQIKQNTHAFIPAYTLHHPAATISPSPPPPLATSPPPDGGGRGGGGGEGVC